MVKRIPLGEGLFPTVWGNVGIADKREGAGGKLPPLQSKRVWRGCWTRNKIPLSAILKTNRHQQAKFSGKRLQVRKTYYGGQQTQANSEANSPDRSEKFSLRDMKMDLHVFFLFAVLRKNDLTSAGKAGRSQLLPG